MKTTKFIFLLAFIVLSTSPFFGQVFSKKLDEFTKDKLESFSQQEQDCFIKMIVNRNVKELYKRIDSTNYNYIFIEESYNSSNRQYEINEKYFNDLDTSSGEKIFNGKRDSDTEILQKGNNIFGDPLINIFNFAFSWKNKELIDIFQKHIKIAQSSFNISIIEPNFYADEKQLEMINTTVNENFKHISKIYTLIDKKKNSVEVYLQTPSSEPNIKIFNNILLSPYGW